MLRRKIKFNIRMFSFILSDIFFVIVALAISGYIFKSLESGAELEYKRFIARMLMYWPEAIVFLVIFICLNYIFGLYSSLWKYAGVTEIITMFLVLIMDFSVLFIATLSLGIKIPFFTYPMSVLICFLAMTFSRMWYRVVLRSKQILFSGPRKDQYKKVMVVGVGDAGAMIIRSMTHDPKKRGLPVVIVDDDPSKLNANFLGIPVAGNRHDIPALAKEFGIERIIIAIPSINTLLLKELLDICVNTGCEVLKSDIAEMFNDSLEDASGIITSEELNMPSIRLEAIKPEDLLGREAVELNVQSALYVAGKTVLISGGAGSIGSEICRQLCKLKPREILVYDFDENNSYSLSFEIKRKYPEQAFRIIIGSVRDTEKLRDTFDKYRPDVVFHAAAHKHVPLMENDPEEAVKNNVFGTFNLCSEALRGGVSNFILISTDKAVNPTNVMGASKRMCEYVIKGMNDKVKNSNGEFRTIFSAVRFGNVLGSNGSVIPLFKRQLAEGGPITITDKRMTRYFMTIPEAAMLVIESGALAEGGEIYILDMGTPVRIDDMARNMIRLAGLIPDVDIRIDYVGLRPGEKLYEELSMEYENVEKTSQRKISVAKDDFMTYDKLEARIGILHQAITEKTNIRDAIKTVVPTYIPDSIG
ncbi:MAG: polysaccharide biosynthesis protein [Saccharofermentanales bacterium]